MPRRNRGNNIRRTSRRNYSPQRRRVILSNHALERLNETEQKGLTQFDVVRAVKSVYGNFFNNGEVILTTPDNKKVAVIFTDTLETRKVITLVGQDRMPAQRRRQLATAASM